MRLRVGEESVVLHPDRALVWRETVVVADVHLGKGDSFRARGLPLPAGELEDDLVRLGALLAATGARRLVVIGDLVHGTLAPATVARVTQWREATRAEWLLVRGNHDRHGVPADWGVDIVDEVLVDGPFAFVHEPAAVAGSFTWSGHLHPTVAIRGTADRLRFPAFLVGASLGVLPAFTRFSGGPVIRGEAGWRRFACAPGEVLALDD
ncbi:MAG: ligase-associated DNA damage response endonuclease PdeM [Deltaproteobacteria bacterium]|nr:ligase-associated DNA damage response endonuclease PdeM [Deltaproteobacteria bacterium]